MNLTVVESGQLAGSDDGGRVPETIITARPGMFTAPSAETGGPIVDAGIPIVSRQMDAAMRMVAFYAGQDHVVNYDNGTPQPDSIPEQQVHADLSRRSRFLSRFTELNDKLKSLKGVELVQPAT